jgi:hypothetical protein
MGVRGQPRQKVSRTPSQPKAGHGDMCLSFPSQWKKVGVVACTCHPSISEKSKTGGLYSRLAWAKSEILFPK